MHHPERASAFEISLPNGQIYFAFGFGGNSGAQDAVQNHIGNSTQLNPYSHWQVVRLEGSQEEVAKATDLAAARAEALKSAQDRSRAWLDGWFYALFAFIPAIVIFALGRGLRYIFSGPNKPQA